MNSEMTKGPPSRRFMLPSLANYTLAQPWRESGEYDDSRVGKRRRSIGEVAIPAASADRILHPWSYDHRWDHSLERAPGSG